MKPLRAPVAPDAFSALLGQDNVEEHCELRSPKLGFMAYHGGQLEKVTDVVAAAAAESSGASYYGVVQTDENEVRHLPSQTISPDQSETLARFLDHVDAVITIHGFGRKRLWHSLLLGGRNRLLAGHVACHLRHRLPDYEVIDAVESLPNGLAGMHPANPVNLPPLSGVQIELPPTVRWNREGRHWSDHGRAGRAPQVKALIEGLTAAASTWQTRTSQIRT